MRQLRKNLLAACSLCLRAPPVLASFGDAEGRFRTLPSAPTHASASLLFTESGWQYDQAFTRYRYLPSAIPKPDAAWQRDMLRFQAEIRRLQDTGCDTRMCGMKMLDCDGVGSSLIRIFLEVQDMWVAGLRVQFADLDTTDLSKGATRAEQEKYWPWAAVDQSLSCKTLVSCLN